jgi:hypothetical protein
MYVYIYVQYVYNIVVVTSIIICVYVIYTSIFIHT